MYERFQDTIKTASEANGVPVEIICGVISQESSWRDNASRYEPAFQKKYIDPKFPKLSDIDRRKLATSYGPMQVMLIVAREMGFKGSIDELADFKGGIEWGCKKLGKLFRKYKSGPDAIAAYNQGNNAKNYLGKYLRAQGYVDSVMAYAKEWEAIV